jgi:predicted AAA+ superfamily ATPase
MRRRQGARTGQFLLLGSASNVLLHQSAESLAGRVPCRASSLYRDAAAPAG